MVQWYKAGGTIKKNDTWTCPKLRDLDANYGKFNEFTE